MAEAAVAEERGASKVCSKPEPVSVVVRSSPGTVARPPPKAEVASPGTAARAAERHRQRMADGLSELRASLRGGGTADELRAASAVSLVHYAASRDDVDGLLACRGAAAEFEDYYGSAWAPLHVAAAAGAVSALRALHDRGASVYAKIQDGSGRGALHVASTAAVAEALVARGLFVGSKDATGRTALSVAASLGRDGTVSALLANGAAATDADAATAAAAGHRAVAAAIERHLQTLARRPPPRVQRQLPVASPKASRAAVQPDSARARPKVPARYAIVCGLLVLVLVMILKALR
eukprot:TRINITY_DN9786_c0_g1_i1.p2 TRINITY_DN9786_c0_g1~~TRINITY_DN9786_c0_g1_i1.p2  ORF type:complete len:294 (+),score=82.83 TRINITY_DN9786_c0_g1_i1:642-1523(+)